MRIQHQISPDDKSLVRKFEDKIPVCTSYIVASLQYQTKIANYHQQVMSMCLSLFNSISVEAMKQIANMEMDIIDLFWMPIEFVGDYNTQKLSIELIVKILQYVHDPEKQQKIAQLDTSEYVQNLLSALTLDSCNFDQLCRQLLNKYNMEVSRNCAVFSVYCSNAFFGSFKLLKPRNMDQFWIDFNYTSNTVSLYCQLRQNTITHKEFFIRIRIDTIKIDNQFNCIVISPEPAIFTTEVPVELKNARIAVFTLPPSEIERFKANKDLLDFYNRSHNYTNSESDMPPTPNTIDNYLGEDSQMDEGPIDVESSNLLQIAPPQLSLDNISTDKSVVPENLNASDTNKEKPLTKTAVKKTLTKKVLREETSSSKPCLSLPNSVITNRESGYNTAVSTDNKNSSVFKKPNKPICQPNIATTSKESGYSTAVSTANQDMTVFKKPAKPLRQKLAQDQVPEVDSKSLESIKSVSTQATDEQPIPLSGYRTRRFFKANTTPPAVTLSTKKPKRSHRKKPSTNTGISPKRKQVNTVKPLNHLIQPDCDPVEANVEYVENGGYFNIIRFLKSKIGTTCFSETQRQQILKNSKMVYENIERGTRRSNQKAAASDSDVDSIKSQTIRRKRRKTSPNVAAAADFVPYAVWKIKQKEKCNGQSTMFSSNPNGGNKKKAPAKTRASLSALETLNISDSSERPTSKSQPCSSKPRLSLNAIAQLSISESKKSAPAETRSNVNSFDRLKVSESNWPSCSKPNTSRNGTNKTAIVKDMSSDSSASSCSNHNFQIMESDNDLIVETDSKQETTIVDMVCRGVPENMELSPLSVPQTKAVTPSKPDHDSPAIEPSWIERLRSWTTRPRTYSIRSEVYEDLDDLPPADPTSPDIFRAKSISDEESQLQGMSIRSSSSSQEAAINCLQVTPQTSPTSIPPDVHTQSERDLHSDNAWYIEKYLRELQPQLYSPTCMSSDLSPLVDRQEAPLAQLDIGQDVPLVQPQNVTIIRNQFIMSNIRKRKISADNEEAPLAKIPPIANCAPLKGYPQLLSRFVEQVNNKKDHLMKQSQISIENVFENTSHIVEEIKKSLAEHETAIHETQEQLSSIYGKLEWLIENQQRKKSQLENLYLDLIVRIKASMPQIEDIDKAYQEVAETLNCYANVLTTELWQDYANEFVGPLQDRLKRLTKL